MLTDSALNRLATLTADGSATFMDAALAVSACIDDTFDEAAVRRHLTLLAERYAGDGTPWTFLRTSGFGGQPPADVVAGSRIDSLLETRAGLPITLAALVAYLAGSAGLDARGINFPGHFLVRVDGTLVDPFALEARTEAQCLASLPARADHTAVFPEATVGDVLLRMFNNLKYHHVGRAEYHRALEMVDCQLQVLPTHAGLVFEQGEYWLRLGAVTGARTSLERILSDAGLDADEAMRTLARRRLEELAGRRDTLH